MHVIVGLGNPGKKYECTRHNVGFDAIDILAQRHGIKNTTIKHKALVGTGIINSKKVILVKPATYMNLSGESVIDVMRYYDVDIEDLIVIYDDFDTDLGKVRIRKKGSAGSHNGMKSIIYHTQDDMFPRVRIGIGRPERQPLADFVLSRFSGDDRIDAMNGIEKAADAVEVMLDEGIDISMNKFNKV